jgi:hypothetical protein
MSRRPSGDAESGMPLEALRMTDLDDKQLAALDRRIKAALGPHWSRQEIGDGDLWAFSRRADDAPIPVHELDAIERQQLEQGTDWRGLQRPEGQA